MILNFKSPYTIFQEDEHSLSLAAGFLKDYLVPGTALIFGRTTANWFWAVNLPQAQQLSIPSELTAITDQSTAGLPVIQEYKELWTLFDRPFQKGSEPFTRTIKKTLDFPLESLFASEVPHFFVSVEYLRDQEEFLPGIKGAASKFRISGDSKVIMERIGRWLDARTAKFYQRELRDQYCYVGFDELHLMIRPPLYVDRLLSHLQPVSSGIVELIGQQPDLLLRGTLIAGLTGSGKSTTVQSILTGVVGHRDLHSLLLLDIKGEYESWCARHGVKYIKLGSQPENLKQLRVNPFIPADRVRLASHIETLSSLLAIGGAGGGGVLLPAFMKVLLECYYVDLLSEYMSVETLAIYPFESRLKLLNLTGLELKAHLKGSFRCFNQAGQGLIAYWNKNGQEVIKKLFGTGGRSNGRAEIEDVISSRMAILSTSVFQFFCFQDGGSIDQIHYEKICLSFQGFSKPSMQLLISMICALSFEAILAGESSKALRHLYVLEESHLIAAKAAQHSQLLTTENLLVDMLERAIVELRSTGTGTIFLDQQPYSKLIPPVLSNTAIKICHHLQGQDAEMMAAAMGVSDTRLLNTLRVGEAYVKYIDHLPPVKMRIKASL